MKTKTLFMTLMLLAGLGALSSCEQRTKDETVDQMEREAEQLGKKAKHHTDKAREKQEHSEQTDE